jgi:membrane-associated phospholipid phosphatase
VYTHCRARDQREILAEMWLVPTGFDLWFIRHLAQLLGRWRMFDMGVQSAIRHNVLGGFWYAAALFVLWVRGSQQENEAVRRRILTTLVGSLIAIVFMLLAATLIAWPPPFHHAGLAELYPRYIYRNESASSFPSQSTTLYAAVAAGVFSLHRVAGWLLWAGVVLLVGLPRIYVGGHYPTDVLAGVVLGLAGYATARYLLEPRLARPMERVFQGKTWLRVLGELVVFAWILQVAVGFRDVVWLNNVLRYFLK